MPQVLELEVIADTTAELMAALTPPIGQTIVFDAAQVFMLKILLVQINSNVTKSYQGSPTTKPQDHKVVCDVNDLSKQQKHVTPVHIYTQQNSPSNFRDGTSLGSKQATDSQCEATFTWQCIMELGLFLKWPF